MHFIASRSPTGPEKSTNSEHLGAALPVLVLLWSRYGFQAALVARLAQLAAQPATHGRSRCCNGQRVSNTRRPAIAARRIDCPREDRSHANQTGSVDRLKNDFRHACRGVVNDRAGLMGFALAVAERVGIIVVPLPPLRSQRSDLPAPSIRLPHDAVAPCPAPAQPSPLPVFGDFDAFSPRPDGRRERGSRSRVAWDLS